MDVWCVCKPYDVAKPSSVKRAEFKTHLSIAFAEYLGTTLLVFLSCLGSCFEMQGNNISSLHTSFTAGLAVTVAIQTFGHISGAHVNPAVSLNALILNQIGWSNFPTYILSQILGSVSGAALFAGVTKSDFLRIPQGGNGICVTVVNQSITEIQGLIVEISLSIILNLAICASWDVRNSDKLDSISLKIGLLIVVLNLGGGAYTGASMNPCRSFGPAIISNDFTNHWIYWTGPITGALLAATIYKFLFLKTMNGNK